MKKKQYHKNSKKNTSRSKNNLSTQKRENLDRYPIIDKIILLLYLSVGFLPNMKAFDVVFTQWYYIAILNMLTLGFMFLNKAQYKFNSNSITSKYTFLGAVFFFLFSCISIFKSISLSESFVFLNILITTLTAFFSVYIIVKEEPKEYFVFIAGALTAFLAIESLQVLHHFIIKNQGESRSVELFKGLNPTYGNRNIFAASLIIKLAFTFYLFFNNRTKEILKSLLFLGIIFISILSILLIGARTAIYSLPIIISLMVLGEFLVSEKKKPLLYFKNSLLPIGLILGVSFFVALSVNPIHKEKLNSFNDLVFTKQKKDLYPKQEVAKKTISLASDSGRKVFWQAALDGFKSSPIIGVGIGNWKLIKKEELVKSRKSNNYFYPRRAHNDFLQVLSEVGILGFLLFLGLFGLIYFVLLRNLFNKDLSQDKRLISLICLAAFLAYSLDTLINFPSERTPIQIMGFIIIALVISFSSENKRFNISKNVIYGLLSITAISLFLHNKIYTSSKYQLLVRNNIKGKDILKEKYKISYEQMNNLLPNFPTLNGMGQPIDYGKAVLAYSEGKHIRAMEHLDKAIKEAPYQQEHYGFKALIYHTNKVHKNKDSAFYYANKVLNDRPSMMNQYIIVKNYYKDKKDTVNYLKTINKHLAFMPKNYNAWIHKIDYYLRWENNVARAEEVVDSAKLLNLNDKKFQDLRLNRKKNTSTTSLSNKRNDSINAKKRLMQDFINKASKSFIEKNYQVAYENYNKAIKFDTKNYKVLLNIGITDIKLKNYKRAIKTLTEVIEKSNMKDGRPEYNRGLCYLRLGNKKQAGIDFRSSFEKGYKLAKKLDKKILNY